jgi:threonine aldolase
LLALSVEIVETNIVIAKLTNKKMDTASFRQRLKQVKIFNIHSKYLKEENFKCLINQVPEEEALALGVRIAVNFGYVDKTTFRILTHCDVSEDDIELVLKKLEYVCEEYKKVL